MSDVFIVLLAQFGLVICKSDPRSHFLRMLALTCPLIISPRPLSALLIEGLDRFCHEDSMRLISDVR